MLVTLLQDHNGHKAGESVTLLVPEAQQAIANGIAKPYTP